MGVLERSGEGKYLGVELGEETVLRRWPTASAKNKKAGQSVSVVFTVRSPSPTLFSPSSPPRLPEAMACSLGGNMYYS